MSDQSDGPDAGDDQVLRCSFCSKDQYQLRRLVSGPDVNICEDCVEVCADIMADDRSSSGAGADSDGPVVGSIVAARCSLCRTSTPATDLITVDTRGALCESCLSVIESVLRKRSAEPHPE